MATTMNEDMSCDVVIAGCGVAGLYAALNLPTSMNVVMLSKGKVDECDSMLAQGGICVLPEGDDYEAFFADTLRAGHYENRRESVDIMIRSSRSVINDLIALGTDFERMEDGSLDFTREGAHSRPRIAYHADITGKEITTKLLAAVRRLPNVRILENVAMVDILEKDGRCEGILAVPVSEEGSVAPADELAMAASDGWDCDERTQRCGGIAGSAQTGIDAMEDAADGNGCSELLAAGDGGSEPETGHAKPFAIRAANTIWATGGIGGVYDHSTNFPQLTGDACYIATKHGVRLEHLDYVQIHPTGLFSEQPGRTFLISESCRGEGAVLLNAAGERFTDELQPRDVVAAAITEQMKRDGAEHEWLSFEPVPDEVICGHFTNIRARCLEDGRDILSEPIPVVPTQHYFMGGVWVDRDSATTMPGLYAAGETSCNGVHGKNRLASNSLLESLVFARRAAHKLLTGASMPVEIAGEPVLDGRHRRAGDATLAIDELCEQLGTAAADGAPAYDNAPVDCDSVAARDAATAAGIAASSNSKEA